jgi:hypothetical protein
MKKISKYPQGDNSVNRRQILETAIAVIAGVCLSYPVSIFARDAGVSGQSEVDNTIYLHPAKGDDSNSGTKDNPLKTLAGAARCVNENTGTGSITIILTEGIYAVGETAVFDLSNRSFTKNERLTLRAEILPDDPEWHTGRMPTLIHTMPLSPTWNGRPDPFGGVAYGMQIETSHVTIQGLKILGMPAVEHPTPGAIHRVYPIGRSGRDLDDLEIKQCLFAGDEATNPNHLGILANGTGIVVDHCIFYNLKQSIVYWSGGSTGHAMRNCLIYGAYGCGIWTSGIANDFEYRNNIVANSNYVWIAQGAESARREAGQAGAESTNRRPQGRTPREPVHYRVQDCLFSGNKKFTGTGGGPALNFRDIDPGFLELIGTKTVNDSLELELDQTKRNYLHPVEGSEAAQIGAGLFTK